MTGRDISEIPEAPIHDIEHPGKVWLLVVDCPYCHEYHSHGGGDGATPDPRYLGHRAAHCKNPRSDTSAGYLVTDPSGLIERHSGRS